MGAVSDLLKVSKFQKQIFLFSFPPKIERNNFFALRKMGKIKKTKRLIFIIIKAFIFDLTLRTEIKNNFVHFLEEMRTRKFASEIY